MARSAQHLTARDRGAEAQDHVEIAAREIGQRARREPQLAVLPCGRHREAIHAQEPHARIDERLRILLADEGVVDARVDRVRQRGHPLREPSLGAVARLLHDHDLDPCKVTAREVFEDRGDPARHLRLVEQHRDPEHGFVRFRLQIQRTDHDLVPPPRARMPSKS